MATQLTTISSEGNVSLTMSAHETGSYTSDSDTTRYSVRSENARETFIFMQMLEMP